MTQTWSNFYEALDAITSEDGVAKLTASFTPNNGIRIRIEEKDDEVDQYAEYDFTENQAEEIGQFLIRWAQRSRAEGELARCKISPLRQPG